MVSDRRSATSIASNENWVPPYDPKTEPRANTHMNHPAAYRAEKMIIELSESIQQIIRNDPYEGKEKYDLLDMLKKREKPALWCPSLLPPLVPLVQESPQRSTTY